jgi:hypothetical protein
MGIGVPLDVFVVRKLGVSGHEEVAMGAIASGGVVVINDDVVRGLGIGPEAIASVAEREGRELLRRERTYRQGRPPPELAYRTVVQEIVEQVADLEQWVQRADLDEHFFAERNAKLVEAAAAYYRSMFTGRVASWNLRDRHMVDTLDALVEHLTRQRGTPAKVVVWAHNSHVGETRAVEPIERTAGWERGELPETYPFAV